MPSDAKSVLAKLATAESTIEKIFAPSSSVKPEISTLKEKIEQMEQFVWELPSSYSDVGIWRNKIASFWARFQTTKRADEIEARTDRLQQKLPTIESIIEKLFSMSPPPLTLLKGKLDELEDAISHIPPDSSHHDLTKEWREKLASFWVKFSNLWLEQRCAEDKQVQSEMTAAGNKRKQDNAYNGDHHNFGDNNFEDNENDEDDESLNRDTDDGDTAVGHSAIKRARSSEDEEKSQQSGGDPGSQMTQNGQVSVGRSLEEILTEMIYAFSQVRPIDRGSDLDGMKGLLKVMSQAGKHMIEFSSDIRLKQELFNYAFEKLPQMKREEFQARFGFKYPWNNLARFLSVHCIANALAIMDGLAVNTGEYTYYTCCYCLTNNGHKSNHCPYQGYMLCVKCYEFGHIAKFCKSNHNSNR